MKTAQQGFTLIELVVVIVILGILAATAIPKFIDLEEEARQAATEGIAGNAASAAAINFAGCATNDHDSTSTKCTTVDACADIEALVSGVDWGNDYDIVAGSGATTTSTTNNTEISCAVDDLIGTTTNVAFSAITAGN